MWARIQNGTVAEVTGIDPSGRFHPTLQWVACPEDCEQGWSYDGVAFAPPPGPTLEQAKAAKLAELRAACDAACAPVRSQYPMAEQLSWDQQVREAEAYQADNTADTPLLTDIAANAGLTLDVLAGKVIAKAAAYKQLSGAAIGKRQHLEDQVDAATTIVEVESISW